MGFDRLVSFLIRNIPNNKFDEVSLKTNYNKIVSEHIIIDTSFILYNCYIELEEEINDILKNIYSLANTDYKLVISNLDEIFDRDHWKSTTKVELDGINSKQIADNFINFVSENNYLVFLQVLAKYTVNKIVDILKTLFFLKFTKNIVVFFDSIPSYSKILEQRKRRIKNYEESIKRKKYYSEYFDGLDSNLVNENGVEYDYLNYINNRFSCSRKIIDSESDYVNNIKQILKNKIDGIKIDVDDDMFGEADYKIFKYIKTNKLEDNISILSCDSDLLYQSLVQQCNYNCNGSSIKLNLVKFYQNNFDYCQLFNADSLVNFINSHYKSVNNTNNNNFMYDFLFIIIFFGNDLLPSSLEIGSEISFDDIFRSHYKAIKNNNVIEFKIGDNKTINFANLSLWLRELDSKCYYTKILLLRHYRINYNLASYFTDKLGYNISEIKENVLLPYLSYKGSIMDNLEENDIRKILYEKNKNVEKPKDYDKIDSLLESNLNFIDLENYGLMNNDIEIEMSNNTYHDLYSYIHKKSKLDDDPIILEDSDDDKVSNYLMMMYYIVSNFFNDIVNYKSTNISYYKYESVPKISDIIKFIDGSRIDLNEKYSNDIKNNIIKEDDYFDSTLHYLIITPYIIESKYIEELENKTLLKKIILHIDGDLVDIWNFKDSSFKNINPRFILNKWVELLDILNNNNFLTDDEKNNLALE